jgi:anti-sigma regulatory factor (Ser/Thr protein kinase)
VLRLDVPLDLAALANAQERIEAYLLNEGAGQKLALRVRLVLEELLVNLVMHGRFALHPRPAARVAVALDGTAAQVTIEDAAAPFDPRSDAGPLPQGDIAERPVGGLGLPLVRRMAQILDYRTTDGGWNQTRLQVGAE